MSGFKPFAYHLYVALPIEHSDAVINIFFDNSVSISIHKYIYYIHILYICIYIYIYIYIYTYIYNINDKMTFFIVEFTSVFY